MDIQPITKIKISKEKWLNQKVKYEDNTINKDLIEEMSLQTYEWINSKNDFHVIKDFDSFKSEFINLLYNKYLDE